MADNFTILCIIIGVTVVLLFVYYMGKNSPKSYISPYENMRPLYDSSSDMILKNDSGPDPNLPHPVLQYQKKASLMTHPANYGDPIRPLGIGSGPSISGFHRAYGNRDGPIPGGFMGIPVPQASLKMTSEAYGYPFHYQKKPLSPYDYFKPYGPNQSSLQSEIVPSDSPFYNIASTFPGLGYTGSGEIPFIGSSSSFAPFPEVQTAWEKTGMIQTVNPNDDTIMNLYRRPIAPLQDLWEYTVQDKNGFVVPLKSQYLEDGDIIKSVPGRESLGSWKVNIYNNNKWIWV